MSAIPAGSGSFSAIGAGVRAMHRAILFDHAFGATGLADPSLRVASEQLAAEGRSLVEAGTILARHETVGTLLDVVG